MAYRKTVIAICQLCGKEAEMKDIGHTHPLEGAFYLLPSGWEGSKKKHDACFCDECKDKAAAVFWPQ